MKFSKDFVLFCHITTQIDGEKNGNLLEEKGGEGFPYIIFMDAEGKVLAVHQDDRTAEGFSRTGRKVTLYLTLKAKADKGDKTVEIDYILAQLDLGKIKMAEGEKLLKEAGTPKPEQQAKLDVLRMNASVMEMIMALESEEDAKAAGKKFYAMLKDGKPGPTNEMVIQPFYVLALGGAEEAKDTAVFEKIIQALKAKYGVNEQTEKFFEAKEKKLAELKAEKK